VPQANRSKIQRSFGSASLARLLARQPATLDPPAEAEAPYLTWSKDEIRPIQRELRRLRRNRGGSPRLGVLPADLLENQPARSAPIPALMEPSAGTSGRLMSNRARPGVCSRASKRSLGRGT
jgi:hypothetical protein